MRDFFSIRACSRSWLQAILLFVCSSGLLRADTFEGFTYVDDGPSITITGYTNWTMTSIVMPSRIDDKPVTRIGDSAFFFYSSLTNVTLGSSVTNIGNHAFFRSGLCTLTIPDSVTSIGMSAFYRTGLSNLTIGANVAHIGAYAFKMCESLTNVTFSSSVTSIGGQAFGLCSKLDSLRVDAGNPVFESVDGVLFGKGRAALVLYPPGRAGSYAIPDTVTRIESCAFWCCKKLTDVTIPFGVTSFGEAAFQTCLSLTSLTIPDSVTDIGKSAFIYCGGVTNLILGNSVTNIGDHAFDDASKALTSLTLPDSVTRIGDGAFYPCNNLTSLRIPSRVASIGRFVFGGCGRLPRVDFLGNAPSMGPDVFWGAPSGFTVYSHVAATGFTFPTWAGYPSLTVEPKIATASPLPYGAVGVAYRQTLTATGGLEPFTWSLAAGALPGELSLGGDGVISGTPAALGTASFTVQVIGDDGLSSTGDFSLTIGPPLTVTLHPGDHGAICEANAGSNYVTMVASGAAFPAVVVTGDVGYVFAGWDPVLPDTVTNDFDATAQYVATHIVTLRPGDHGSIVETNSGVNCVWVVNDGEAFPSVTVNADAGWLFTGWSPSAPVVVTNDFDATARYTASCLVTLHPGEHGSIWEANAGVDHMVTVSNGAAFPRVPVEAEAGWVFNGWNPAAPAAITDDFEATAAYAMLPAQNAGMVVIPAGTNSGADPENGEYSLSVASFCVDRFELTKAQWDEVADWAATNGYDILAAGGSGKAGNHPVCNVTWYECVKWCNARSERESRQPCYTVNGGEVYRMGEYGYFSSDAVACDFAANGYRLPTTIEWEYAARGGGSGKRFPWGDTIEHSRANYLSTPDYDYDQSPTRGYHPYYDHGGPPSTSPAGAFAPNGYGLYDMSGNVWEWIWDSWFTDRQTRGGGWMSTADYARCIGRGSGRPSECADYLGFRAVFTAPPSAVRTLTLHPGPHGRIVEANAGADCVLLLLDGAAFPPTTVVPEAGWTFMGWQPPAPELITDDFVATAVFESSAQILRFASASVADGLVDFALTDLQVGHTVTVLRCQELAGTAWSTSGQFVARTSVTNWSEPAVAGNLFFRLVQ